MAEGVQKLESNILYIYMGQICRALPGSESMACNQSKQVNVGDPDNPSTGSILWKYLPTSLTNEEAEMAVRKSEGSYY